MEWYEFLDKMYDWSESTIKTKIYQLKEIDPDDLEAVMAWIGFDLSDQLIRKAMRLKTPITKEIFNDIEEMMSFDVANELRAYIGLDRKLNPFENMMKSLEDIDENEFEKQVRAVSAEIERKYGVKAHFPEEKIKESIKRAPKEAPKIPDYTPSEPKNIAFLQVALIILAVIILVNLLF